MRYRGFEITIGGRWFELVRMPSLAAIRDVPPDVLRYAQGAYELGLRVSVRATLGRWVTGLGMAVVASLPTIVLTELFPETPLGFLAGTLSALGVAFAMIHIGGIRWPLQMRDSTAPDQAIFRVGSRTSKLLLKGVCNLGGRVVVGDHRESVRLWRQALTEVNASQRAVSELPMIHQALLVVADLEDQVTDILARSAFELDQSAAEVARLELGVRVAQTRELMGLPQGQIVRQSYLNNRWGQEDSAGESEVFDQELR